MIVQGWYVFMWRNARTVVWVESVDRDAMYYTTSVGHVTHKHTVAVGVPASWGIVAPAVPTFAGIAERPFRRGEREPLEKAGAVFYSGR
jgi:hypothetical protein